MGWTRLHRCSASEAAFCHGQMLLLTEFSFSCNPSPFGKDDLRFAEEFLFGVELAPPIFFLTERTSQLAWSSLCVLFPALITLTKKHQNNIFLKHIVFIQFPRLVQNSVLLSEPSYPSANLHGWSALLSWRTRVKKTLLENLDGREILQ